MSGVFKEKVMLLLLGTFKTVRSLLLQRTLKMRKEKTLFMCFCQAVDSTINLPQTCLLAYLLNPFFPTY